MPIRKRYASTRRRPVMRRKPAVRRRTYKRATRAPRRKNNIVGGAIPVDEFIKFKYSDTGLSNTVSGGCVGMVYRMNSIYDPDTATISIGRNASAYALAQYGNMYNNYTVYAMKIKTTFTISNAADATPVQCIIYDCGLTAPTLSGVAIVNLRQYPKTRFGICTTQKPLRMSYYTKICNSIGCTAGRIKDDDGFTAGFGSNPNICPFVALACQAVDGIAVGTSMSIMSEITFYTRVWSPRYQNLS